MPITTAERRAIARTGGLARAALYDGHMVVVRARSAFERRFVDMVLADAEAIGETLTPTELERRAAARLREHMARLTYQSIKARRLRRERAEKKNGREAEALPFQEVERGPAPTDAPPAL